MIRRFAALAIATLTLVSTAACGNEPAVVVAPKAVPDGLVPDKVQGDVLAFFENTSESVKDAFANAGKESLAADGRMWELRRNDRLVGTYQIATLLPEVELDRERHRQQILRQIMPATVDEFEIGDTRVFTTGSADKSIYLWFGEGMFAVLTLKGNEEEIDPDQVVEDVVGFTTTSDGWLPLFIDDSVDSEES